MPRRYSINWGPALLVSVGGQVREASFERVGIGLGVAGRLHRNDETAGRLSQAYTRVQAELWIRLVRWRTVAGTPQIMSYVGSV